MRSYSRIEGFSQTRHGRRQCRSVGQRGRAHGQSVFSRIAYQNPTSTSIDSPTSASAQKKAE